MMGVKVKRGADGVFAVSYTHLLHERIVFSGGRIGCQVEVSLEDLRGIVPIKAADLTIT